MIRRAWFWFSIVLAGMASASLEECPECFENRLRNYGTARDSLLSAGRQLIADYLRDGHNDSAAMVVRYCDSLTMQDSSWLDPRERFRIKFIGMDSAAIFDLDFLCSTLEFYDTTKAVKVLSSCEFQKKMSGSRNIFIEDNLYRMLFLMAVSKLAEYKRRYPRLIDAWEFFDRIVFQRYLPALRLEEKMKLFRSQYPKSRFSVLKAKGDDYFRLASGRRPRIKIGGTMLAGANYTRFSGGSGGVLFNGFSADFTGELIFNSWVFKSEFELSSQRNTKSFNKGTDYLPSGWPMWMNRFYIGAGRTFAVNRLNHVTPGAGVFFFIPSLTDSVLKNSLKSTYDFPVCTGTKIGLDFDHIFWVPDWGMWCPVIRISAGVVFDDYRKISASANNRSFYFSFSAGAIGFDLRKQM